MSPSVAVADDWATNNALANPTSSANAQKKPRHRHAPEQLAALNELFDKDEHPPLEIRSVLAERLGMETKTVNAWFQNKRASSKKRSRTLANDRQPGSQLNSGTQSSAVDSSTPTAPPTNSSTPGVSDHPRLGLDEDEYYLNTQHIQNPIPSKIAHADILQPSNSPVFIPQIDYPQSARSSPDSLNMPKKMRMRPSSEQTEHLKRLYNINPHPSAEERQALADRIGMRYQSITNWFQNQRSLAKRRKDDEPENSSASLRPDYPHHDTRQYSAFPPPPPHHLHDSLTTSDQSFSHPHGSASVPIGKAQSTRDQRSPSASPSLDELSPRRSTRRSTTPYGNSAPSRPRRSRPEPYQLDALKILLSQTDTPTIEERSALALEVGMDVGKVTNWFRNLRQTARKRSNRFNDQDHDGSMSGADEDIDDLSPYQSNHSGSRSDSRNGTPSLTGSSSPSERMDTDVRMREPPRSHAPSDEEDYSEAITPEPGHSPSPTNNHHHPKYNRPTRNMREDSYPPPPFNHYSYHYSQRQYPSAPPSHFYSKSPAELQAEKNMHSGVPYGHYSNNIAIFDTSSYPPASKSYYANEDPLTCAATAKRFGINIEDAYLLLDFHRQ
ncbi:hypothetical protein FA15DRAFT_654141 [Coprinopsis marcescibilis]|uniref:Homeobox domain-containing protein n=1 Tax=Coprinopsis marcescibilis TaxID=230819 RepID=A0A5C3L2N3_COPMA|nr:hypothetical protein FA15DRAFT_654141 [Coprinopsis marcescibilis]